jgi:hypothetical protein
LKRRGFSLQGGVVDLHRSRRDSEGSSSFFEDLRGIGIVEVEDVNVVRACPSQEAISDICSRGIGREEEGKKVETSLRVSKAVKTCPWCFKEP